MYSVWNIIASDIATKLNRCGSYDANEIINVAEELGYTRIKESNDTIEAVDPDGYNLVIAEQ